MPKLTEAKQTALMEYDGPKLSELGQQALQLARDGWHVFPLALGTKIPLLSKKQGGNGCLDGTTDEAQIRKWWRRWPNAGIGANMDGLLTFDVDKNHGGSVLESFPSTRVHLSGRCNGNRHLIYQIELESLASRIKPGNGALGPGMDIKTGRGNYLVMPPTPHEETGKPYTVGNENGGEIHTITDDEIRAIYDEAGAVLPGESRNGSGSSGRPRISESTGGGLAGLLASPPSEGGRNDWLAKVCGHLARQHRSDRVTYEAKVNEANDELVEPMEQREVDKTAESIWAKEQAKPTEVPLEDSPLAEWVADRIGARHCWASGLGWLTFDGKVWKPSTDATITEAVRQTFVDLNKEELDRGAEINRLKRLPTLLSAGKIRAVVGLLKGIVEADAASFDCHPELLSVGNGVVDLRTGQLLPHDPAYRITKHTKVEYRPGARSKDWDAGLTALPEEVADWMQVRLGQATTGHMTPDDVLPILQGGGSNGKSTVVAAVAAALGDHAVTVPEKLLIANPGDHPTELTTLMGARLAVIEELPDGRLSIKRLKSVVGTPVITARKIAKDNVTWEATHSLFLTSNYRPRVQESDLGTWRRLALVRFPYTFRSADKVRSDSDRKGDPGLRDRLRAGLQGQREAVLAWLVDGAKRWYDAGRTMPPAPQQVADDTESWRGDSDLVYAFVTETLVFDPTSYVLTGEVYDAFTEWLTAHGLGEWSDQTFARQLAGHELAQQHGVTKELVRAELSLRGGGTKPKSSAKHRVWRGLRWRSPNGQERLS